MSSLTSFKFLWPNPRPSTNQLLDFFDHVPLLRQIELFDSVPSSSNTPAERVVSLPHLKLLKIYNHGSPSILLNHLHIPAGASVTLDSYSCDRRFPVPDYLPKSLDNLGNISHINSINLTLNFTLAIRLHGPSGDLLMGCTVDCLEMGWDSQILRSLNKLPISSTESLRISGYHTPADLNTKQSAAYQTLLTMNNLRLRTLTLINCINLSFILALNPDHNASNTVVCPKLEKLVLDIQIRRQQDESFVNELLEMAKARASIGVGLSTITIVRPWELVSEEEVRDLKHYVVYLEYGVGSVSPRWDALPGDEVVDDSDSDKTDDDGDSDSVGHSD